MKNSISLFVCIVALLAVLANCGDPKPKPSDPKIDPASSSTFSPVKMPSSLPGMTGWKFPEDSVTVDRWISQNDTKAIYQHAWGVWDALTSPSGEKFNNETLLVFETWYTPEDVQNILTTSLTNISNRPRHNFQTLHQLAHGEPESEAADVVGFVKWDPTASDHIIKNKLLLKSTLEDMRKSMDGKNAKMIPEFPNTAVALKPVFQNLSQLSKTNGLFWLQAWPGSPATPQPFDPTKWGQYIFVDVNNKGATNNTGTTTDTLSPTPNATYGLGDFIQFQLDSTMAAELGPGNNVGDYMILLAMHITTKETKRWTWQTMFWSNNPAQALLPSSNDIVAQRPATFQTPSAGRYAMSVAYSMVLPSQPYTGGSGNNATSIYAFNPWLEAGFTPTDLPLSTGVGKTANIFGVQSNCMSCHGYASYPGLIASGPSKGGRFYTADRYVDMGKEPEFTSQKNLQVDFLWSIQGNIIADK